MSNDKPNLTDSHFADMLMEPFAELFKPKVFYPTITIEHAPTVDQWAEIVETIWIGALEGGSTHWIDGIHTGGNDLKTGMRIIENFPINIHHGSDGWGNDDDAAVEHVNSFDVIIDGINLLDTERKAKLIEDIGQLDANDYDYIIQLGVFGKEVYC